MINRMTHRKSKRPVRRDALTLADILISWKEGDRLRVATGRQIAHLLTTAAARTRSDLCFGIEGDRTGQWIYKLRGLARLVSTEADASSREDERAVLADLLEQAAAELLADQLDSTTWPTRFTVQIQRSAGGAP